MIKRLSFTITPFTEERFKIQKPFHYEMTKGVETLLAKVMGRQAFEGFRSIEYRRVIPHDRTDPIGRWLCILTDNDYVISISIDTQEPPHRLWGRFYGYEDCCIAVIESEEFINKEESCTPLPSTGFYPCDDCRTRDYTSLVTAINRRRIAKKPFPKSLYCNDVVDLLHKVLHGTLPLID